MENILHRIKQLADNEGITIASLEKKIGASKGVLSKAIAKNTDIQSKWIQSIVDNYPNYSTRWLISGKGEMISAYETPKQYYLGDNYHSNVDAASECREQQYNISKSNNQMRTISINSIPYFDLPVSAGPLGILNTDSISANTPAGYCDLPLFEGCEFILPVQGISMEPIIRPGDFIGIKKVNVPNGDLSFIRTGQVYLIVTKDDRMIKLIEGCCKDDNYILVKSYNYPPFKILKQDILEIHLVKAVAKNLM